jgi:acetyl esterase/lipase
LLLLATGLAYHFAALRIFNALIPKDPNTAQLAAAVPYGPDALQYYDLYAPINHYGKMPVLVFVHGGGWDSGQAENYEFVAKAFAAKGYLVYLPAYRHVPQIVYPAFVEDVAEVIKQASQTAGQYGGDGQRIFLVGHSAGGYNILQVVLNPQFLKNANVDPTIIKAVAALAAPADFLPLDSPKSRAAFGNYKPLEDTQPINFARSDAPPILLLHGSADDTVLPKNSINLSKRLQDEGAIAQYTEYKNLSHVMIMLSLAKPLRNRAPVLADIEAFFNRYK